METKRELNVTLQTPEEAIALFGVQDKNLKILEREVHVEITTRGETIYLKGITEAVEQAEALIQALLVLVRKGIAISAREMAYAMSQQKKGTLEYLADLYDEEIIKNVKGHSVRAKSLGQKAYVQAIQMHDMIFSMGPAGTGKTYLAIVLAVKALKANQIKKIILTRPAVEAGESLGFLPGDLKEKVDPYLRPLYDALHDILGQEYTEKLMERGTIEVAPLAYMRGRTLDDAFIILDESQNTTAAQIKMFLTRLGFGSKMIITGDQSQVDLPRGVESGLMVAERILKDVNGIAFIYFDETDVVRHPLVAKIVKAYGEAETK